MDDAPLTDEEAVTPALRSFSPLHLLYYVALVACEATLIHLAGILIGSIFGGVALNWVVIAVVVAISAYVGARFDMVRDGWRSIEPFPAVIAGVVIIWAIKAQLAGASPISGWGALGDLLRPNDIKFVTAYLALATTLWAWVAGAPLTELGHRDIVQWLRRAVIGISVALVMLTLIGVAPDPLYPERGSALVAGEIVVLLGTGLLSLAAARLRTLGTGVVAGARSHWLRSSIVSSAAILIVGVIVVAIFAGPAGNLLRAVVLWTFYILTLIASPLIWLLYTILHALLPTPRHVALQPLPTPQVAPTATADASTQLASDQLSGVGILFAVLGVLLISLPIIALIIMVLYRRRQARQADGEGDEIHTSLFTWGALRDDLSSWARNFPFLRRGASGLRGALDHLRGEAPALRIRRRYIQLLLRGEAAERHREPPTTPREWGPSLAIDPTDHTAIDRLTDLYERARYAPESVDSGGAEQADRAWQALEQEK